MGKFEAEVLSQGGSLLDKIILWKRFIDDVLMFFKGREEECKALVDWLNSIYPGVI